MKFPNSELPLHAMSSSSTMPPPLTSPQSIEPLYKAIQSKCRSIQIISLLHTHHYTQQDLQQTNTKNGRTILHEALHHHKRNTRIISILLHHCPSLISIPDCEGRTPLHTCILSHVRFATLKRIVKADPSKCLMQDYVNQNTPLHLACQYSTPEMALLILQSSPTPNLLIQMKNSKGKTALRLAIRRKYFLPVIQELLNINPAQKLELDEWGRTPLHEACSCSNLNVPWNDVQAFFGCLMPSSPPPSSSLSYYEDEIKKEEDDEEQEETKEENELYTITVDKRRGMTPLMGALLTRKPTAVARMLLLSNPLAASITDNNGRIPLIVACQRVPHALCRHDAFIIDLIRAYPPAATASFVDGESGMTALAAAVKSVRSPHVITSILEEEEEYNNNNTCQLLLSKVDKYGRTPLFLSCLKGRCDRRWKYRDAVLSTLLSAHPDALGVSDCRFGRTPLFAAIRGGRSWHVIRALIKFDYRVLYHVDCMGRTALHVACGLRTLPRELTLLEAGPPTLARNDALLLQELASIEIPQLACVPDGEGRIPLNVALECGRRWDFGVRDIFRAAPEALGVRDVKTGLFPALLAAVKRPEDDGVAKKKKRRGRSRDGEFAAAMGVFGGCGFGRLEVRKKLLSSSLLDQHVTVFHLLLEDPTILSDAL